MPGRYGLANLVGQGGYRYGFNGQEKDDDLTGTTGATYDYGFRIYDARIAKFLSVDPLTGKFPELSTYQFASNSPIVAVDLDGLEAFVVHGTWSKPNTFAALGQENYKSIIGATRNNSVVEFQWTGNNVDKYRKQAAKELVAKVLAERKPGEPLTIVGHSHGGNVGIMATNILNNMGIKVNYLITINTPAREYQLNENSPTRQINIYNDKDKVQAGGGNFLTIPDSKTNSGWEYEGSTHYISGEYGLAGRTFDNATNIKVPAASDGGFLNHNTHEHPELWRSQLKKSLTPIDFSKINLGTFKPKIYKYDQDNTRVSNPVHKQ